MREVRRRAQIGPVESVQLDSADAEGDGGWCAESIRSSNLVARSSVRRSVIVTA